MEIIESDQVSVMNKSFRHKNQHGRITISIRNIVRILHHQLVIITDSIPLCLSFLDSLPSHFDNTLMVSD